MAVSLANYGFPVNFVTRLPENDLGDACIQFLRQYGVGTEKIVRDPVTLGTHGELICVGEVPEESYVDILSGNAASLIDAAGSALRLSRDAFPVQAARRTTLLIDCISRVLFLEDEFQQELKAAFEEETPLFGALTLGEIANSGKDYLEFYNKTAVIAALEG